MLTQDELKKAVHYDPLTGLFIRLVAASNRTVVGTPADCPMPSGYLKFCVGGREHRAHRLAWLYVYGYLPEFDVDHINRDPSDNRITNLREVHRQCNSRNTANFRHNTSGVKGVGWHTGNKKWRASIMVSQRDFYLGLHHDFLEAVCHRLAAEQALDWAGCDSSSPAYQYVKRHIPTIK